MTAPIKPSASSLANIGVKRRRVLRLRRPLRAVAAAMTVVLAAGLAAAPPAQADPAGNRRPKVADHERPVPGKKLKVRPRTSDPAGRPGRAARASWPQPATAQVTLAGQEQAAQRTGTPVRAGELPVWLGSPSARPARAAARPELTGQVTVQVLDRQAAERAGVHGLMFTLTPADTGTAGRLGVRVDYAAFAQAFGGSYGPRLQLVRLPACAVTTPGKPECRNHTAVPGAGNNAETEALTADVDTAAAPGGQNAAQAGGPVVLAAVAAPEGSQGDFKATKLEPSATWKVTGNTGDFTWSYPARVPPVPGGLTPKVELGYSAQSVDGRAGNTNNQPSWAGEGFDLWPGFIERRYKTCEDDGVPPGAGGKIPGDLCWGHDNATITWNGKGGELVQAADGTWRLKNDDGTRFERLTSADTGNGDNDGEYWKVTTTDGTRYFFGLNRLPGFGSGGPETNSAWTVPVFGDDTAEPCHQASGFADSWCQQAWRWNLDLVIDPNDNAITYFYDKETNHYGRNLRPADATPYTRGGYLKFIEYGIRGTNVFAGAPPARVLFDTSERCIPDASFDCAPAKISTNPDRWPDVPWDMNCEAGTQCASGHGSTSPTFWSRKRLTKITTLQNRGSGFPYRNVDSWSLDHQFGAVTEERDLLAKEIGHTGLAGPAGAETIALPKVTFNHTPMANRLDQANDGIPPYTRYRVSKIFDESGGEIDITYSGVDCSRSALPTPETNTRRCYPSIWHLPGQTTPITDWFNKYVTTSVVQKDRTGGSPDQITRYTYLGGAAWHFDDDGGLTRERFKTWSQWRGFQQVRTTTGPATNPLTQTDSIYLRGMHGDKAGPAGGSKTVTVPDGEGSTHTDLEGLDGFELKTIKYLAPGGAAVHDKTVNTPWRVTTATRQRSWGTVTANAVHTDITRTWTAMDGGTWRETKTDSDFETDFATVGRVKNVNDLGDVAAPGDDKCTRTEYADNLPKGMVSYKSRDETVAVACTADTDRSKDVIADTRTFYDNGGFSDPPTKGDITKTEKIAEHDGTTATYVTDKKTSYDAFGRPLTVTNALDQTTITRYTETAGLTTKQAVTSPPAQPGNPGSALTTSQDLDPAWGQPTVMINANGQRSDLTYDALGRLAKVWLPDHPKATNQIPSLEFGYQVTDGQIVAVTKKTLTNSGGQRSMIELFDGWLRSRQTQAPGPDGRLIADTLYDARGQIAIKYADYSATGAPQPALFGADANQVETQTHYTYDGLNRPTVERLMIGNGSITEKWRTTTSYGGNWKAIDPPQGGIPTAEISDARDRAIERRQYSGGAPTGGYDATSYRYDGANRLTTITDPSGNTWTNTYDLRGRKTRSTDPDKGTTIVSYDDLDRQITSTDARDKTVFTSYDGLGRKTSIRQGSATGRLLASWTYDTATRGKGLPATAARHGSGGDYTTQIPSYDPLGRPEATTVTVPGSEGPLAGSYTFTQAYNLDGSVKQQGLPTAGGLPAETLTHTYDNFQRPTRLTSATATYVNATDYTPTGKPKLIELGTTTNRSWNTLTWEYGTRRLATSRTTRENITGTDRDTAYRYDDVGNVLSIADTATAGTDTQCLIYDHLRRLTQAWTEADTTCTATPTTAVIGGPAPYWHSFSYDKAGNRTQEIQHGTGGQADTTRTYTYAAPGHGNRLTSITQTGGAGNRTDSFNYDASGNTTTRTLGTSTQTLDYNDEGELTRVTDQGNNTTSFVYDADGNRLIRKDPGGATLYLPAGTELRATTGATTAIGTRYYTHNDQPVAMRDATGLRQLTGDHQGTPLIAINTTNQQTITRRSTPFGQERGVPEEDTWPGEKGFVGGTKDPTGLTHLGAREYDPEIGRFTTVDPLMDPADPQQLNGYSYANNNPVTTSDPDGQIPDAGVENWVRARQGLPSIIREEVNPMDVEAPETSDPDAFRGTIASEAFKNQGDPAFLDNLFKSGLTPPLQDYVDPRDARSRWQKFVDDVLLNDVYGCATEGSISGCLKFLSNFIPVGRAGVQGGKGLNAILKALRKRCGSSFVPGTQVLMADGSRKSIEAIKVGDQVLTTDPQTGETQAKPVLATISSQGAKKLVQISVDPHRQQGMWDRGDPAEPLGFKISSSMDKSGLVIATDSHPFWLAGGINKWIMAADLKPGMWLRTSAGTYVQVTAIQTRIQHKTVHNLSVADTRTYYVLAGGTPVLVHNANPSPWNFIDGRLPQRGQTALYMIWDTRTFEFVKWGVWTNTTGNYTRYSARYMANKNWRMHVIKNYDSKEEALARERYLTKRAPGPANLEDHAGKKRTGQSWAEVLDEVRRGACD